MPRMEVKMDPRIRMEFDEPILTIFPTKAWSPRLAVDLNNESGDLEIHVQLYFLRSSRGEGALRTDN